MDAVAYRDFLIAAFDAIESVLKTIEATYQKFPMADRDVFSAELIDGCSNVEDAAASILAELLPEAEEE